MPFKEGSSQKAISSNIKECISSYKNTGKIGNTKPKSLKHAIKICKAAAMSSAKKSKKSKSAISEAIG